jgi:hypothetical protein
MAKKLEAIKRRLNMLKRLLLLVGAAILSVASILGLPKRVASASDDYGLSIVGVAFPTCTPGESFYILYEYNFPDVVWRDELITLSNEHGVTETSAGGGYMYYGNAAIGRSIPDQTISDETITITMTVTSTKDTYTATYSFDCSTGQPPGRTYFESCGHGYWRKETHFDSWPSPYTPDTLADQVLIDPWAESGPTLLEALQGPKSLPYYWPNELSRLYQNASTALLNAYALGADYVFAPWLVQFYFLQGIERDIDTGEYYLADQVNAQFEQANSYACPLD